MHTNCYEEGVLRDLGGSPAEIYERHTVQRFGLMGARDLLDLQPPHVGDRLLDVACGTGAVTRLVAERVAPRGRAIGLDVDPSMLAVGRTVDRHQPGNRATLACHPACGTVRLAAPRRPGFDEVALFRRGHAN
jgi:SAM-dependent methyltransferase